MKRRVLIVKVSIMDVEVIIFAKLEYKKIMKRRFFKLFLKLTQASSFVRNDSVWPVISPVSNNFPRPDGDPDPPPQYVHFYGPHLSGSQGHVRLERPRFGVAFVVRLLPHNLLFRLVG